MMGFFIDTKEKMKLLGIAIAEETKIENLKNQIAEFEKQKKILNKSYNSILNDIRNIKREIEKINDQISLLNSELKSKVNDEGKIVNAIKSQKQRMQSLVKRYNSLTKEEKTLRKYFGEFK
jgi:chromosome segregation ATPase